MTCGCGAKGFLERLKKNHDSVKKKVGNPLDPNDDSISKEFWDKDV